MANPFMPKRGRTTAEFTKNGTVVIEWDGRLNQPMPYRLEGDGKVICKANKSQSYNAVVISNNEMLLSNEYQTKKLVRESALKQGLENKEKNPPVAPAVAAALTKKLAGEWFRVEPAQHPRGNYKFTKQTVFFSQSGTIRYEGTRTLFTGSSGQEEASGKFEVVAENKIKVVGKTTIIEFDFISDAEFVATFERRHFTDPFEYVTGKFRRVK